MNFFLQYLEEFEIHQNHRRGLFPTYFLHMEREDGKKVEIIFLKIFIIISQYSISPSPSSDFLITFHCFLHSQIFLIFRFSWSLEGNARNRQQATTWCLQVPYMPMIIMTILINANDCILYLNCWFSDPTDLSRGGDSFVGKLRSNMLGTQVGTEDDSHMMLMIVIVMVMMMVIVMV